MNEMNEMNERLSLGGFVFRRAASPAQKEKEMRIYEKVLRKHLKKGGIVRDWLDGEPGMCSNGGLYYTAYRLRAGRLEEVSSYEEDLWKESQFTFKGFIEFVISSQGEPTTYDVGPRFQLKPIGW